jgi:thiol-disulfide isomerase/thioredoxin
MKHFLFPLFAFGISPLLCAQGVIPPQEKPPKKPVVPQKPLPKKFPKLFKVGKAIDPALTLKSLDGKTVSFKNLRGKVVVVHFWSTRCPFVKVSDPKMLALAKTYGKKGVLFFAINANHTELRKKGPQKQPFAELKKVAKQRKLSFPVLVDPGNKAADRFQARTTPHCYVIDAKGILRYQGALDNDPRGRKGDAVQNYLAQALDAVLAGKKVSQPNTRAYGCSIKRVVVKKPRRRTQ